MKVKKIVNEKEKIERKLSELEIEKNQTLREISKLESDYCVSLTSRYTDTSDWDSDDQYIYNELERIYRELSVKTDRYKKQLKRLEA